MMDTGQLSSPNSDQVGLIESVALMLIQTVRSQCVIQGPPSQSNITQSQGAKPTRGPGGLLVSLLDVGLLDVGLFDVGLLEDAAGINLHLPILFSFQSRSSLLPGNEKSTSYVEYCK